MYFVECNHCRHLNAIKTEYQTFCESCGKKMSENYQDWKKINPGNSFIDYKNEVCQQQDKPIPKIKPVKGKSKSKLDLIVLISSIVVFALLGTIFSKPIFKIAKLAISQYNLSQGKFHSADPSSWQLTTSVYGNFEVLFPGHPTENNQKAETEIGELDIIMFILAPEPGMDDNLSYIAGYTTYPAYTIDSRYMTGIEIDEFMDQSVQGSSVNVNGVIIENNKIQFESFPGRDFTISLQNGVAIMRGKSYLINNTLYSLNVIEPINNKTNKSTSKFLDSFRLLESRE